MAIELELIFFRLHKRVSQWFGSIFNHQARRFVQSVLVILSLLCLLTFVLLHCFYVRQLFEGSSCMPDRIRTAAAAAIGTDGRVQLLRVRVLPAATANAGWEAVRTRVTLWAEEYTALLATPRNSSAAESVGVSGAFETLPCPAPQEVDGSLPGPTNHTHGLTEPWLSAAEAVRGRFQAVWREEQLGQLSDVGHPVPFVSLVELGASFVRPPAGGHWWRTQEAVSAAVSSIQGHISALVTGTAHVRQGSAEAAHARHLAPLLVQVASAASARSSVGGLAGLSGPISGLAALLPEPEPAFTHARDKGLLELSSAAKDELGVSSLTVTIAADEDCIGPHPVLRWLLRHLVGYNTAIINALIAAERGRGFVLAELTGTLHALAHATEVEHFFSVGWEAWLLLRVGTVCSAVFLLFAASALVSFVFAQTQQRMLRFTVALQHHVRARLPLLPLVASHLLDSLIFVPLMLGVLFFLFEFCADQLLAFLLLLVVWLSELWSITACRTVGSLRFFPRLFGITLTWYNAYHLSYPLGFQYLALGTCGVVLTTGIFHLWHTYELPALVSGAITASHPRHPFVAQLMHMSMQRAPAAAQPGVARPAGAASAAQHSGESARHSFHLEPRPVAPRSPLGVVARSSPAEAPAGIASGRSPPSRGGATVSPHTR